MIVSFKCSLYAQIVFVDILFLDTVPKHIDELNPNKCDTQNHKLLKNI